MKLNAEQQALVEANLMLVPFTINRFLRSMSIEYEDMVSIGYIALCRAAWRYNPDRGYKFSSYAVAAICRLIRVEMISRSRQKRGVNCVTVSFDEIMASKPYDAYGDGCDYFRNNALTGYEPDFADKVLDKVLCEPVWKMCPTHKKLCNSSMTAGQLGKLEGVTSAAIFDRRKNEFNRAKEYLNHIGVYESI